MRGEVTETAKLAAPLALAQLATFTMGMVDCACVGRFSPEALGGVAMGNSISFGLNSLGLGFCMTLDPLISQALGAGEERRAWEWWRVGRWAAVLVGLPLALLALLLAANVTALGIDPALGDITFSYVVARCPGLVMFLLYLAGRSYLQCKQQTRGLVVAAIAANAVNLVLDLVLVFGDPGLVSVGLPPIGLPPLGAIGAGVTTACSTMVLAAVVVFYVQRNAPEPVEGEAAPKLKMSTLWTLGLPLSFQQAGESWLFAICGVLAGRFGPVLVSAHQVALVLAAAAFMTAIGASSATSVRVGSAVGVGDEEGARRAGLAWILISMMLMGTTATLFLWIPEVLVSLMTDQPEVIAAAVPLMGFAAAFAVFD
ncbi:MAG: MATE family efflux transporter, partial [Myxococcota bacterium]|nr:MATE family efflux transporter [Myxococcota bacterium]